MRRRSGSGVVRRVAVAAGVLVSGVAPVAFGSPVAAACSVSAGPLPGAGTAADPHQIRDAADLLYLSATSALWTGKHFKQTNDILLTGCAWSPIGQLNSPFSGTYDGNSRRIYDLTYSGSGYVGLFGLVEDTTISDLMLIDPDVTGTGSGTRTGALAGALVDDSIVSGVEVTGADITGPGPVGGLIGQAQAFTSGATLRLSDLSVAGSVSSTGIAAGGVIGNSAAGSPNPTSGTVVLSDVTADVDVDCVSGNFAAFFGGVVGSLTVYPGSTFSGSSLMSTGAITEDCSGGNTGGAFGQIAVEDGSATLEGVVASGAVSGSGRSGGLIGALESEGSATARLTLRQSGSIGPVASSGDAAGGLVGITVAKDGSVTEIVNSVALGPVTNSDASAKDNFGGLIGRAETSGTTPGTVSVSDTSASGPVSGDINNAGGLIGSVTAGVTVSDSYSVGAVQPGGGSDSGGLIGLNSGTVTESFWDTETSGMSTSAAGSGKTTAELQSFATFSSIWSIANEVFDLQKAWLICGGVYPIHMWFAAMGGLQGCAPSGVTASGVDGTASVTWVAPGVFGTQPITSYTVTASPGGASCTATAPAVTCDVTGLTVGTSYTFSVTATDGSLTGPAGVSAAFPMTATPPPGSGGSGSDSSGSGSSGSDSSVTPTTAPSTAIPAATVPETSVPVVVPVRDADGNLPSVSDPSKATMVVNGVVSFLDVTVVDETRLVVSGDGFEMALAGSNTAGESSRAGDSGRLEVTDGGLLQVSGTGFDPGSEVDIWVMSDPVFAGTVTVGADGSFAGSVPVPEGLVVGPHTVQANGVTADGVARSLNLGIELVSAAVLPATGGSFPVAPVMVVLLAAGAVLVVTARRRSVV